MGRTPGRGVVEADSAAGAVSVPDMRWMKETAPTGEPGVSADESAGSGYQPNREGEGSSACDYCWADSLTGPRGKKRGAMGK